jgi:NAD(P)-dependent dehydrogenase (short-subunit alcohol dehydrogenase family)
MNGKICLVTGATSGVGLYTALGLARKGAEVILVGRRQDRAEAAARLLQSKAGRDPMHILLADLSRPSEIRRLAQEVMERVPRLDVLVNDAGGFFFRRGETDEGLECTFALNHLSYFLLSHLLLDLLAESAPSRVVNVASNAHWSNSTISNCAMATTRCERTRTPSWAMSGSRTSSLDAWPAAG